MLKSALTDKNVLTDPGPILVESTVAHNTARSNALRTEHLHQGDTSRLGDTSNMHPVFGESRNLIPAKAQEEVLPDYGLKS